MEESVEDFLTKIKRVSDAKLKKKKRLMAIEYPWADRYKTFDNFVRQDFPGKIDKFFGHTHVEKGYADHLDTERVVVVADKGKDDEFACCGIYRLNDGALASVRRNEDFASMKDCCEACSTVFINSKRHAKVVIQGLKEAFDL